MRAANHLDPTQVLCGKGTLILALELADSYWAALETSNAIW